MTSIAFHPRVTQAVMYVVNICAGIVSVAHAVVKASTVYRSPQRHQVSLIVVTVALWVTRAMIARHPSARSHVEITASALDRTPAHATAVGQVQPARKQYAPHHVGNTANALGPISALATMDGRVINVHATATMVRAVAAHVFATASVGWGPHAMSALQTPHLR